jgi:hypothetical protein
VPDQAVTKEGEDNATQMLDPDAILSAGIQDDEPMVGDFVNDILQMVLNQKPRMDQSRLIMIRNNWAPVDGLIRRRINEAIPRSVFPAPCRMYFTCRSKKARYFTGYLRA